MKESDSNSSVNTPLTRLILSGAARRAAFVFVQLFSPVYIFNVLRNQGIGFTNSIILVFAYYILVYITRILSEIWSEDLSQRWGLKNIIRFSIIPFALFLPSISLASKYPILFILSSTLWGVHAGLFWWGYHGYFVKKGTLGHFGFSLGEAGVFETLVLVFAPLLGVFLISGWGFEALYFASFMFMILAVILLGRGSTTRQKTDVFLPDVLRLLSKYKRVAFIYALYGGEWVLTTVYWPFFLYLFFGKTLNLGIIVSFAVVLSAFFSLIIGKLSDDEKEFGVIRIGSIIAAFSWFLRFITPSITSFIIGDGLRNFGERMVSLPLSELSYKKASEDKMSLGILFMEISVFIGIIISLVLMIIIIGLSVDMKWGLVLAGIFSFLIFILLEKTKNFSSS